jgi:hypothetical protein
MGVLIAVVLVLALLGGVLGTLLEIALWSVVLIALAFAVLGFFGWRAVTGGRSGRTP